jgi:CDP-diacylglycerol--glycerol-3-phosphate 3-phosphatidyltransferase
MLVPLGLTVLRAALGPVVIALALLEPWRWAFGACLIAAFLSDVFDGILARRWGVATPNLRRLDSFADSVFYLSAVLAVWRLHPQAITDRWTALLVLATLEVARYILDFLKFQREASYHMWSSKLWGIALFAGFFSLLALDADNYVVDAAIYVGVLADVEGLAISLVLRHWQSDVPTLAHAFTIRRRGEPA